MKQKDVRKIGFFSAISICIGSIIGIGIFLKNDSVGKNVDGNGASWLITWIISGLIALLVAYHFGKITKVESNRSSGGLSSWVCDISDEKNNWFKKIVSLNYGFFYCAILVLALSFFTTELLISFLNSIFSIQLDVWVHILISLALLIIFICTNYFSIKATGIISLTTTILKFIPLLTVILVGIIFYNNHNLNSETNIVSSNGFNKNINPLDAFQGIMISIPAVLFAFDSFANVGVLSKQIKGNEKTVSKVIVISIITTTIIYLLISVSSILHYSNNTTVLNVLIDSLPKGVEKAISIIISFFLFVSAYGTTNSIAGAFVKEYEFNIEEERIIGSRYFKEKFGSRKGGLYFSLIVILFWILIIFVPSMIINSDSLIDGFSNLATSFFFLVYAYMIFQYWKNIYLKENNNQKQKTIYGTLVWMAIASVLLVVILNLYIVLSNAIQFSFKQSSWGLYLSGNIYNYLTNLDVLGVYISSIFIFFSFPFLNSFLIKKIEKRNISL